MRYLVEKYQSRSVGHALAIVGNRDDAPEAVQEAFLDAFQGIGGFDSERPFYPWLYTILRNRCFKLMAGRKRLEVSSLGEIQAEILAPESSLSPEELLSLEQALLVLSPEDRELITLKHLDGLSYRELAERLGTAEGTVRRERRPITGPGFGSYISLLGMEKSILAIIFAWLALRTEPAPPLSERRRWGKIAIVLGVINLALAPPLILLNIDKIRAALQLLMTLQEGK